MVPTADCEGGVAEEDWGVEEGASCLRGLWMWGEEDDGVVLLRLEMRVMGGFAAVRQLSFLASQVRVDFWDGAFGVLLDFYFARIKLSFDILKPFSSPTLLQHFCRSLFLFLFDLTHHSPLDPTFKG